MRVDLRSRVPVVFLQEESTRRSIPIFIGTAEATAIAYAMEHTYVPRPLTHDLQVDVIAALGASVVRVVITEIRDATYFAELHLDASGGPVVVSARPSDAIAIAARTDAPIFVADDLLDTAGVMLEEVEIDLGDEGEPDDVVVDEFLEFLDNVRPEDFSG
ncbi:MAG TPA: bifunctional nuclease family protein [Acidimicrobiales bacterium]|nr:bifunctional nuclease family protein [Acidimicrobiales bacterium]